MGVSGYGSGDSCFQKERLPHIPLGWVRGLHPYQGNATIPAWRWHTLVQGGTKVCTFRRGLEPLKGTRESGLEGVGLEPGWTGPMEREEAGKGT